MNEETVKQLEKADWARIILQLGHHAVARIKRYSFKYHVLPMGLTVEDIVMESIEDTLSGARMWDPVKNPDLLNYLRSVVNSKISHLFELKEYQVVEPLEKTIHGEKTDLLDTADGVTDIDVGLAQPSIDPEDALLEKEEENHAKKIIDLLFKIIDGDNELEEVVICLLDGIKKPSEIAKELGADVKNINNRQKRLRRKFDELKHIVSERRETHGLQRV